MREFVYTTKDGKPSRRVNLPTAMLIAGKRLLPERQPYAVKVNEKDMGRWRRRRDALKRLRRVAHEGHVGNVYRIRTDRGVVFQVREAKDAVKTINTNGNAKADRCWSAVKDQFPKVYFLGAYVCKEIAGSSTMSQHSYGNAVDVGAGSMDQLHSIANWVVAHHGELDIATVIVDQRIWTPGSGWTTYGGLQHFHVHCDFSPAQSGSCGVRG